MVQFTPTQGPLRGLRGVGLAGTASSLSVAAHAAAGGSLPGPVTTFAVIGLLSAMSAMLADRRRSTLVIMSALGLSQCALHYVLQITATHHASAYPGAGTHLATTGPGVVLAQGIGHHAGMPFDSTAMSLGHVVAAVLTGLLLAGAEDALFLAGRLLGWVLPRKPSPLSVTASLESVVCRWAPISPPAEATQERIHAPRGPPRAF